MKFLRFIRQYGPVAKNDNMYDETIRRSAKRNGVEPIKFEHPAEAEILGCYGNNASQPVSVILTGTAGDGKTHLLREVWQKLGGDIELWSSDNPYLQYSLELKDGTIKTVHFIRDLSGWAPQQGLEWEHEKLELIQKFCESIYEDNPTDIFLIAANDGQLVESWRRLPSSPMVNRTRDLFEELLVEDKQSIEGVCLKFFNLSRWGSAELFTHVYKAFIEHDGWAMCYQESTGDDDTFGVNCPVRHNYELLKDELVYSRIRCLIELCDHCDLHLPIRQLLLLLSNAVLGHPDCPDNIIRPKDIPEIIRNKKTSKASLYNNVFGGNLSENRRRAISIFDYFERFQIGYETSNRIDNILIYGDSEKSLNDSFKEFIASDTFYGADDSYYSIRNRYIEGAEEDTDAPKEFLDLLISQRRGLFFKIPHDKSHELKLWDLTVFRYAGEYLHDVLAPLGEEKPIRRAIRSRLVMGLNRIFTGMLVNSDRELLLATSGNFSQAKISRVLKDRLSVEPRHGERITVTLNQKARAQVEVHLSKEIMESWELNLVRFEFLSRVATEGALPASFSKECYEDVLAFKSRLLAAHQKRTKLDGIEDAPDHLGLTLINISKQGVPEDRFVEVTI